MRVKRFSILLVLAFLSHTLLFAESGFRVAGVQFRVDESMYANPHAFALAVEKRLRRALATAGADAPDLIVFPEYLSAFLALTPYAEQIETSDTVSEALEEIRAANPSAGSIRRIFLRAAERVEGEMDRIWGGLAETYGVAILAGTYFAERGGGLYNLLVVYDENGERAYEQAKVYLTGFERDVIGLDAGSLGEADVWETEGVRIAATICRDTFFESWNARLGDADYWIDIKANGTEYTNRQAARFRSALPERIADTGVSGGMTVCLTGSYLDMFWEGRSSTVFFAGGEVLTKESAKTASQTDVLVDVLKIDEPTEP